MKGGGAGLILLAMLSCCLPALAQPDPRRDPTWVRSGAPGDVPELFPRSSPLYAPHKADPLEFRSGMRYHSGSVTDSPNVATAVGVRPVMFEFTLNEGMRAQVLVGAVGQGRFDLGNSEDLVAEDWRYGFLFATRYERWSYALWAGHLSAHLGDELIEQTGRRTVEYVQEEVAVFASFDHTPRTRYYYGAGYALRQQPDDRRGRVQLGAEAFLEDRIVGGGLGPYVAVDLQARAETGWSPGAQAVLGWAFPGRMPDRTFDLQLTLSSGPSNLRQFFRDDETYAGLGFAVDL